MSERLSNVAITSLLVALLLSFSTTTQAQYKAAIGCEAHKIDELGANAKLDDLNCSCFNKCSSSTRDRKPSRRFRFVNGRDIDGHDLAVLRRVKLETCVEQCQSRANCRAFSYDRWNRMCFLKDTTPQHVRVEPNSTVAIPSEARVSNLTSIEIEMQRYRNAHFVDAGYSTRRVGSFEACESACEADANCEVFTFYRRTNMCKFIANSGEYFRDSSAQADSGVKRQPAP